MAAHDCNANTQKAEGTGLWIGGQLGLHKETIILYFDGYIETDIKLLSEIKLYVSGQTIYF